MPKMPERGPKAMAPFGAWDKAALEEGSNPKEVHVGPLTGSRYQHSTAPPRSRIACPTGEILYCVLPTPSRGVTTPFLLRELLWLRRYWPGGSPNSRLNARLKADSDSYPTSPAISATPRGVFSSDRAAN